MRWSSISAPEGHGTAEDRRQPALQHFQPAAVPPGAVRPLVYDMHFMLQKEVVDRMVAEPGSKDFGRLSVMLQYRYHMERLFIVPPGAFNPPPKVDSAIVRMIPVDFGKSALAIRQMIRRCSPRW
jgi:hypothetical protein